MIKYPVISKLGNEYEVEVFYGKSFEFHGLNLNLYQYVECSFLGSKFTKRKRVYRRIINPTLDNFERYEYDFKSFAIDSVRKYEEEVQEANLEALRNKLNEETFNNWDGDCR